MNKHNQRLCIYAGLLFTVLFGIGWWLVAGFLPPPNPKAGAAEIVRFYQTDTWKIRLGLIITVVSVTFYYPWIAAMSVQMKRIEGSGPVYSWTQLSSGACGAFIVYLAGFFWLVATFRPERNPDITYLLSDLGWLLFTTTLAPFLAQVFSIGLAVLSDKNPKPLLPRWFGFYNLAVGVLFIPACIIFYFKSGPFAWNGIFSFWIPLVDFFIWIVVSSVLMLKAVEREE